MKASELTTFFRKDFCIPDLASAEKEGVLDEMVQKLVDAGLVKSKNLVLETIRKRETLGSTGIGKQIAIPHCRTLAVSDIHIVVGLSAQGVDFNAIDEEKVHLVFLIVAPPHEESNLYLQLLFGFTYCLSPGVFCLERAVPAIGNPKRAINPSASLWRYPRPASKVEIWGSYRV